MIKLKDLIDGGSSAPKHVDESLAISERIEPEDAQAFRQLRRGIEKAVHNASDLENAGHKMGEIIRQLQKIDKLVANEERKAR